MSSAAKTRKSSASEPLGAFSNSAPAGVSVDFLRLGGDEFAVFSWGAPAPAPPPARGLTRAEQGVLWLLVGGASNEAIARARATSARTVANQVASLLRKLGAGSRFELIRHYGGALGA